MDDFMLFLPRLWVRFSSNTSCPRAVGSIDGKTCIGTKHYSYIKAYLNTLKLCC